MDVDDATPQEIIVAAVREVLRSLLMYWLPSDLAREDEHALLQLFRGFITLLTTKDSDTNFLCQQALNKRPIHWDSALTSHQECVSCCLMINAAGAFSPSKDALDYRDDAIHALSELPPFSVENNYLRYTNQDVALVISDYDLSLFGPLFETDYEWEIPRGAYLPLTASLNAGYWLFWRAFFRALISGEHIDLELWRDIALIEDQFWEVGPKAVAEEIEKIQADLLTKRAPLAEEMIFDQGRRTFTTVPIEIDTPDLFRVSLERSEFAYSLAIGGNGLSEACYEAKILSHTFKTCRDDPQTVEMNFMQVAGSLKRQVECHEYPDSPEITGLADTLFQAALDIRATHPAVKEAREKRAQAALHETTPEQKEALADALPVLKAISDDKLAEEFELDFGQVLNSSAGPVPNTAPKLPGADATHRIGNRVAKMSLLTKSSDVAKAIDGSGGYKALRIGTTLNTLVGIIL
ncbi:hypothetical protein [Celeribacter ethanolicus]|uniref:hypothetical protein n=1 Tax=Celeribacter ethanolicus TaxID=1758178 RepID=UPI0012FD71BE|nr:hypothetical protein [Celeribacter ethanolicus]